eukprot:1158570-Pelagomonas_calceolata.AAC.6
MSRLRYPCVHVHLHVRTTLPLRACAPSRPDYETPVCMCTSMSWKFTDMAVSSCTPQFSEGSTSCTCECAQVVAEAAAASSSSAAAFTAPPPGRTASQQWLTKGTQVRASVESLVSGAVKEGRALLPSLLPCLSKLQPQGT